MCMCFRVAGSRSTSDMRCNTFDGERCKDLRFVVLSVAIRRYCLYLCRGHIPVYLVHYGRQTCPSYLPPTCGVR